MNHVILQVPLPQDTLWLECTNPSLPFGYVHQDIAGHDALLIEPTGGQMYRLPTYPDSLNTQHIVANITLSPTAEARIEVNEISRIFQYENEAGIVYLEPNKQKDRIRSSINLSQADTQNLQISECKEPNPSITFDYISFRQLDADAVGICVSVVDVNGIGALRHRRNTEFFSEHIGGDKQTVARFMPVLIAGVSVVEGDRRIGLLALADLQVPLPQDKLWLECTNPSLPFGLG